MANSYNLDLKYVVAPMVEQSELAWRMMMRNHGATLCYTPMLNAGLFVKDKKYQEHELDLHKDDKPVIVQFAANNVDSFSTSAKIVEDKCDGIDLNLGCPQNIAKRGHYGSYLQDDWQTISSMIKHLKANTSKPVSAKIRVFPSIDKSIEYARILEHSGCDWICVHGRTREQKGQFTGLASWDHIRDIKSALNIPVIANGNIQYFTDIQKCLDYTHADGIMVAEGCLYNPYIFENKSISALECALEYISYAKLYNAHPTCWRGHLFKILIHIFNKFPAYRSIFSEVKDLDSSIVVVNELRALSNENNPTSESNESNESKIPYWICKPYFRHIAQHLIPSPIF